MMRYESKNEGKTSVCNDILFSGICKSALRKSGVPWRAVASRTALEFIWLVPGSGLSSVPAFSKPRYANTSRMDTENPYFILFSLEKPYTTVKSFSSESPSLKVTFAIFNMKTNCYIRCIVPAARHGPSCRLVSSSWRRYHSIGIRFYAASGEVSVFQCCYVRWLPRRFYARCDRGWCAGFTEASFLLE